MCSSDLDFITMGVNQSFDAWRRYQRFILPGVALCDRAACERLDQRGGRKKPSSCRTEPDKDESLKLSWYHLASPHPCGRSLLPGKKARRSAVTGAPVAGSIFTCAAPRPSSASRGLPGSILRAFCQAQTVRTLLFTANLHCYVYNTQKRWVCQH